MPAQLLWGAANTCVKISIVHLYIRIFPGRLFSKFCYGVIILTSCYFLSVLLEAFVLCKPVSYNWDKTIPGGKCANENLAFLLAGITNLLIDAIVVILPIPMLWRLQMPLIRKLGVLGMFGLGAM